MPHADWTEFTTADGLVTLRLPSHWEQEDEEDDGTTAFSEPDDEEAGVLRVTPLVYAKDQDVGPKELPRLISRRGPRPERITDSRYMLHLVEQDEEEGEPLIQHTWQMVHQTGPREVVMIVATYTLGLDETLESAGPLVRQIETSLRECVVDVGEDEES